MDFIKTRRGEVVDLRPMRKGGWPLFWTGSGWASFGGTLGDIMDGVPLSEEEIAPLLKSSER